MIGILIKIAVFQFKLFTNNATKFGAPGNRTPLTLLKHSSINLINLDEKTLFADAMPN